MVTYKYKQKQGDQYNKHKHTNHFALIISQSQPVQFHFYLTHFIGTHIRLFWRES